MCLSVSILLLEASFNVSEPLVWRDPPISPLRETKERLKAECYSLGQEAFTSLVDISCHKADESKT